MMPDEDFVIQFIYHGPLLERWGEESYERVEHGDIMMVRVRPEWPVSMLLKALPSDERDDAVIMFKETECDCTKTFIELGVPSYEAFYWGNRSALKSAEEVEDLVAEHERCVQA